MGYVYRFSAQDSSSDDGHVMVVIVAWDVREAARILHDHLEEMGRLDLYDLMRHKPERQKLGETGVFHSTVQAK